VIRPILAILLKGSRYTDPIEGKSFRMFLPYGYGTQRNNVLSPSTLSLERHRLLWLYLHDETDFFTASKKVLHFAPEQEFYKRFKKQSNLDYTTTDLFSPLADVKADICNLPLGFDSPEFISEMANVLKESIQTPPSEIWLSVVSGVLARAARLAFPKTQINAVCVAKNHGDLGHATPFIAPEKFYRPAITQPPYPACPFSDAKVWQFAEKQAVSDAFILNVGV
jgi:hypothetical protein